MFLILKATCFTGYTDDITSFLVRTNITDAIKYNRSYKSFRGCKRKPCKLVSE